MVLPIPVVREHDKFVGTAQSNAQGLQRGEWPHLCLAVILGKTDQQGQWGGEGSHLGR